MAFLEKWAKKKHQKVAEKSKKFVDVSFQYLDKNKDGYIDVYELQYAINVLARDYEELGEKAEDLYAFVSEN